MLRLHAAPSFAAKWLMPRLPSFMASVPGVEVRRAASTDEARFVNDDLDADDVGHYLAFPKAVRHRRMVRAFEEWILAELAKS